MALMARASPGFCGMKHLDRILIMAESPTPLPWEVFYQDRFTHLGGEKELGV